MFPSTFALKHAKLIYCTEVGVLIRFLAIKSYIMILSRVLAEANIRERDFSIYIRLSNKIIPHLSIVSLWGLRDNMDQKTKKKKKTAEDKPL